MDPKFFDSLKFDRNVYLEIVLTIALFLFEFESHST